MTNKPKAIGTRFESAVVKYLREKLGDDRIERRALHGSADLGDIYRIPAHGFEGIAECKSHRDYGPKDLASWQWQTQDERDEACADFGLLVVNQYNKPLAASLVYVTLRDLARIALPLRVNEGWDGRADDRWVCVTLAEAAKMMKGD